MRTGTRRAVGLLLVAWLAGVGSGQGAYTASEAATALFGSNEWLVVTLTTPDGQFELLPGDLAFFKLRADGALAGTAGCNQLSSSIAFGEGQSISFGPVIATRMACAAPQMAQEFAILESLEHYNQFTVEGGNLVLAGGGYEMVLAARTPGGSAAIPTPGRPGRDPDALAIGRAISRYAAAFNDAVAAAAAAGAAWPRDPIRVALAFLELKGAPSTVITREDAGLENAVQTQVSVVEHGFLDDSIAGLEQYVTLDLVDGVWTVSSYRGAWICHRDGLIVPLPGACQ